MIKLESKSSMIRFGNPNCLSLYFTLEKINFFCSYLKVEESKSDVLNDFLSHIFGVELGPELELKLGLFLHVLTQHFFVQLEPGG